MRQRERERERKSAFDEELKSEYRIFVLSKLLNNKYISSAPAV
jgi:hypothetical protein